MIAITWAGAVTPADGAEVSAASARVKVEVREPVARDAVFGNGGQLLADYGSFQLWDAPAEQRNALAARSDLALREGDDVIELHAGPIRTALGMAQTAKQLTKSFTGKRLRLVQFAGPVKNEWHQLLLDQGWRIVEYIPHNAYLVWGDSAALDQLRKAVPAAPHIQFEGDYLEDYKLHPNATAAVQLALKGQTNDLFAIQLVADADTNPDTLKLLDQLSTKWERRAETLGYVNCVLHISPEHLSQVAAQPDVVSIQQYQPKQKFDERQGQILAGNLTGNQPSGPGYLAWLEGKGFAQSQFDTSGFIVDVTDSGIDNGTQTPGHFGLYPLGNRAAPSRVAYNRLVGTPNPGSTIQGCDGHGNLNSHIVAGYDDFSGFPFADSAGYHYGLGICPFVQVGSSVIFDPDYFTSPNYTEIQSRAYHDGARISCNSWGANTGGAYTIDDQEYDALVRDAQPSGSAFPVAGNQEMVIIFAAGNAGPSANTVGDPGSAKNIFSIGAAENVHSHSTANGGYDSSGDDGCSVADSGADNANDIIFFSSRGPCDDARVKPDIMAPGTHVTGGVGQQSSPAANGTALSCFMASGVCALPGGGTSGSQYNFFPLGQQFYTTSSGTSHSTPAVGGGAALLRQYFINHNWSPPSPAMTKAWLMNSARYLTGLYANDTLPSSAQGMGEMNLGTAFDGVPRIRRDEKNEDRFTATGQTRSFDGFIADSTKPLRVTLAWTDAPGSTTGNAYNNNLDLTVTVGGQTYRGNVFSGALSIPGGTADPRNNVESVFLPAGISGPFTVTVTAANIVSDGVPNNGDALDQDFALVIYNSSDRSVALAPAGATLTSESYSPANSAIDPGETVTVNLSLQNLGPSNTIALVATLLATNGVTSPSSAQSYGVVTGNGGSGSRAFSFTASGACGGTVKATLQLQDGTNDYGTVQFPFRLGLLATNTLNFPAIATVSIGATDGVVTPYPSIATVSGVPGRTCKATVTLNGLSHTWPDDLDVLLVGPQGQSVMLMSDAGGGNDASDLTLTFDDSAANNLPDEDPLASGSWKPTDFEPGDVFSAPAPAGPFGSSLGVFGGTDPNGQWKLFVADDYPSDDGGEILNGWTLTLVTTNSECCVDPTSADVGLRILDSPDPVSIGSNVVYTLLVTNSGPAAANGVTLVSALSASAAFVSVTVSQGTYWQAGGTVMCDFGTLPAGGSATATITAQAVAGPQLTATAMVFAGVSDPNQANNSVTETTAVPVPALTIQDASVTEGDSGMHTAVFLLALSETSSQVVSVDCVTTNGSATAGADYIATTNRVSISPGEIFATFEVPILGDTLYESNETFRVLLANPVNASVSGSNAATGLIVNDDLPPAISVGDASVVEGNAGTTSLVFPITLSAASGLPASVTCTTSNGTAQAGTDYLATTRTIIFAPGQTSTNFAVTVFGDTNVEPDETLFLKLSNPVNAGVARDSAVGTIITDDFAPLISATGFRLISETGGITNGVFDFGETVTVSLALENTGSRNATNLVATLQASGGVSAPSGAQNYGTLIAGGPQVARPFTFTVGAANCSMLTMTVSLQDGAANLGTASLQTHVGNCLFDDFDPNIDLSQWSSFGGVLGSTVIATNYGGSISGSNSLWFGGDNQRYAATRPVDAALGGTVSFYLHLANGVLSGQWEQVDLPYEGVVLEYSVDGGASWALINGYSNSTYYAWTYISENIPGPAQTPATMFRWRQLSHSGACCDHWALDDVRIVTGPQPPMITMQPVSQTVISGNSATLTVGASGSSPLAYQWKFYGTNLPGATNAILSLLNVQSNNAGPYVAVVTNTYGCVTSSVATLTVVPGISLGEAVDATNLIWTTGGNTNWFGQSLTTHDGMDAAQSGDVAYPQSTWLQTTVTGPGTLSYWWRVSSYSSYDYLTFVVDGITQYSITGESGWQQQTGIALTSGTHTLRWNYSKGTSTISGSNKGWVDQVVYTPSIGSLDHFVWGAIAPTQTVATPFAVGITALDAFNNTATNFNGMAAISAWKGSGGVAGTILQSPVYTYSSSGSYTLGYAFTPSVNLTITHIRSCFGTKVSIWTDGGSLLASQNVSGTAGTWTETPLATPVQLTAGVRYRVAAYTGGGTYYWRTDLGNTFPSGTIDQSYESSGDAFPTSTDSVRWWFVDLRYGGGNSLPVAPTNAGPFVAGVWSGSAAVLQPGTNVTLVASDGLGHSGSSGSFVVVVPSNTPPSIVTQPANQTVFAGQNASFSAAAYGSEPLNYQWRFFGTNLPAATNATLTLTSVATNQAGPYSVMVTNAFGSALSSNATLTVVQGVVVSVFDDPSFVDTAGTTSSESDNIQASLTNAGYYVATFMLTNLTTVATSNALLLFPEFEIASLAPSLSLTQRAALSNAVCAGGTMIINGSYTRASALINSVFGLSVVESASQVTGGSYNRTVAAAGTAFADDPLSIPGNNGTSTLTISSLPPGSKSIYDDGTLSVVAELFAGNGKIIYLGWDWFDAAPHGTLDGGWLTVLQSAVMERAPITPTAPAIVVQPSNQTNVVGTTATISVSATGSGPLAYQWRFYGTNLPAGTNVALQFANVQSNQAGPYRVVITNALGSVTSSVATLTIVSALPLGSGIAYMRSSAGEPWGTTTNDVLMDRVFGAGNWQDLRFETASPNTLFANRCIFMDGSDGGAASLATFLNANRSQLETWVASGGRLFLNAAPNIGTNIYFGFGVNLVYPDITAIGVTAQPAHPIFSGPYTPAGTNWNGSSFGHATLAGTNLTALITNNANGHLVLAELNYGNGRALFGGMTTPNFHSPGTEAGNLRANILARLAAPIGTPALRMATPVLNPSAFSLWISYGDGSPMIVPDLSRTVLLTSTNLSAPPANWQMLANPLTLTNSQLRADGLSVSNDVQRFFRVRQNQ